MIWEQKAMCFHTMSVARPAENVNEWRRSVALNCGQAKSSNRCSFLKHDPQLMDV